MANLTRLNYNLQTHTAAWLMRCVHLMLFRPTLQQPDLENYQYICLIYVHAICARAMRTSITRARAMRASRSRHAVS